MYQKRKVFHYFCKSESTTISTRREKCVFRLREINFFLKNEFLFRRQSGTPRSLHFQAREIWIPFLFNFSNAWRQKQNRQEMRLKASVLNRLFSVACRKPTKSDSPPERHLVHGSARRALPASTKTNGKLPYWQSFRELWITCTKNCFNAEFSYSGPHWLSR